MTGDDFVGKTLATLIVLIAICGPAAIATLVRKYHVQPQPTRSMVADMFLPPLIYIGGFLLLWISSIYTNWDGSKTLAHLVIAPVHYPLLSSSYAALVGIATAAFSVPLSRELKKYWHHVAILAGAHILMMAVLIFLVFIDSDAKTLFF